MRVLIAYLDNLDSEQTSNLERRYGISGPGPGSTLIITHLWDTTEPLPTATPTRTPIPSPTPTLSPKVEVEVFANQGWQGSITVQQGQQFQIEYISGQIRDGTTSIFDGSGSDYVCGHAGCCEPMPEARRSSLVGRIGDEVFFVGNGGIFEANSTGVLLLRINDCDSGLHDNSGSFRVRIIP